MTHSQNRIMVKKPWSTFTHLSLYPPTKRMNYVVDYLDRMKIITAKKPKKAKKKISKGAYLKQNDRVLNDRKRVRKRTKFK